MLTRSINKVALEASLCRDSLYDFLLRFWPEVCTEPLVDNWHIKYLCDEIQRMCERVFRRQAKEYDLIVNVAPGSTKSIITSVMTPPWVWTRDQTFRTICGSYAHPLALYLATQSARVVKSDKYRLLFPEIELEKDSAGLLVTKRGGWRYATSTGGSVTGMHAHLKLVDDPINPKEAISDIPLLRANEWLDHTLVSRNIDKRITPTILIMQRLHQDDPTGHALAKKGGTPIRHICLPARISENVRPRSLRDRYVNGLFDPVRLNEQVLTQAETDHGIFAFSGQYQQSPVPLGAGMFQTDMIGVINYRPQLRGTLRYWDKAATAAGNKHGCFTVGVLMGFDKDRNVVILDVKRGQWEAAQRERIIRQTAESDGKQVLIAIEQEPGSGGKESAQMTVKNLAGFRVRIDKPVGDKVLRADPLSVYVNKGFVKIVQGDWNQTYLNELAYFPFSTYKDQVDASSGAFAVLTGKRLVVGALG